MKPADPRFIACRAPHPDARIVLFGIPFEGTVNLRTGADHGPHDLRVASDSIETYSPFLDRDLEDLGIADLGDCELGTGSPRAQLDRARDEIRAFWRPRLRPVMLGGDHTATLPVIEVLAPAIPELRILQLDAHPDTREEFLGERYNYASAMARVMDVVPAERVYQVGMRTGSREEFER
ncbi:MAG TPA: arginase family protein, partial [Methylomirabilota bacterium]|nr:arginase family protein [Methylomirabilota bacterium]